MTDATAKGMAYNHGYEHGYAQGKKDAEAARVRCKDCKHRVDRGMCYMISGCPELVGVGDNFWCAYGERKAGAE